MNGGHDLGGMMGFGPIDPEPEEPVFHAEWERRMFAIEMATGAAGGWPIDEARHTHERATPTAYLSMSYYERWLASAGKRLLEHGLATAEEIASGRSLGPPAAIRGSKLLAADVAPGMATGKPYSRPTDTTPAFSVGDRVRTRNIHPAGHTRLPRYARGRIGTVERINGYMVFPDANAHGLGEDPKWNYAVSIDGAELWGPDADPAMSVSLDLWEPHLEGA